MNYGLKMNRKDLIERYFGNPIQANYLSKSYRIDIKAGYKTLKLDVPSEVTGETHSTCTDMQVLEAIVDRCSGHIYVTANEFVKKSKFLELIGDDDNFTILLEGIPYLEHVTDYIEGKSLWSMATAISGGPCNNYTTYREFLKELSLISKEIPKEPSVDMLTSLMKKLNIELADSIDNGISKDKLKRNLLAHIDSVLD